MFITFLLFGNDVISLKLRSFAYLYMHTQDAFVSILALAVRQSLLTGVDSCRLNHFPLALLSVRKMRDYLKSTP